MADQEREKKQRPLLQAAVSVARGLALWGVAQWANGALRGRRCAKLARIRGGVLLLLEDGEAMVVEATEEGCRPQRLFGDVEDVLETEMSSALLRLADGSYAWA